MAKITTGSVFESLGFSDEEQVSLKMKADIFNEIIHTIEQEGHTAKDLESILDIPQPRVSELMNGRISKVSIEKLIGYLQLLGKVPTKIKFKKVSGF